MNRPEPGPARDRFDAVVEYLYRFMLTTSPAYEGLAREEDHNKNLGQWAEEILSTLEATPAQEEPVRLALVTSLHEAMAHAPAGARVHGGYGSDVRTYTKRDDGLWYRSGVVAVPLIRPVGYRPEDFEEGVYALEEQS